LSFVQPNTGKYTLARFSSRKMKRKEDNERNTLLERYPTLFEKERKEKKSIK